MVLFRNVLKYLTGDVVQLKFKPSFNWLFLILINQLI